LKFLLDENFNNDVLRGLLQEKPDLDIIRAQDVPEVLGKGDPTLLAWAAKEERIVLSHDFRTFIGFAYDRVQAGELMPGVIEVRKHAPIGKVIEDILFIIEMDEDITDQVIYVPL
jgi:Domain of unknown function (DUF5615)